MQVRSRHALIGALLGVVVVSTGCPEETSEGDPLIQNDVPDTVTTPDIPPPPDPTACTTNDECAGVDGTNVCTVGLCDPILGQCTLFETPGCCTADEQCDDGDSTTIDSCDLDLNVCQWTDPGASCQSDGDCDTGEPCVSFSCDSVCSYWKQPGCCTANEDCEDGDPCTANTCVDSVCESDVSDSAICCGDVLLSYPFTAGFPPDSDIQTNDEPVVWQTSQMRWRSPPRSAWFGNAQTGTYENPVDSDGNQAASQGVYTTGPIDVPAAGGTLRFSVWVDLEKETDWDLFEARVLSDMSSIPVLWSKSELDPVTEYRTWVDVEADLTDWAGTTVRIAFAVDTIDATVNKGEGVYLDDIAVVGACDVIPTGCQTDADCADDDPCTSETCGADGECTSSPIDDCCVEAADCPPAADECTVPACQDGVCEYLTAANCCTSDADCSPLECKVASCDPGLQLCVYDDIPECCAPDVLAKNDFENAAEFGYETTQNEPGAQWFTTETRAYSPPTSLRFADELSGTYDVGVSVGTLTTDPFAVPAGGASFDFRLWADIEAFPQSDTLEVRVQNAESGQASTVWTKAELAFEDYRTWTQVTIDLGAWAGQSVVVWLQFDTVDGLGNEGEGIYLDDLRFGVGCSDPPPLCDPSDCDDGNACTTDTCDGDACLNAPIAGCVTCEFNDDCEDGDICTIDLCNQGACQNTVLSGCLSCDVADDCPPPTDTCDVAVCTAGSCEYVADPDCAPCTTGVDCNDGDPCTLDLCNAGDCQYAAVPNCGGCAGADDCDDGEACTADSCVDGLCVNTAIPGCGADCTVAADCNDNDPCTQDSCSAGACVNASIPECCVSDDECQTGDPCSDDACVANQCVSTPIANCGGCTSNGDCADGDICTIDFCNVATGECAYLPNPIPGCDPECESDSECADDDGCTNDVCQAGQCQNQPIAGCCAADADCDDGDACTIDTCDQAAAQCSNVPDPDCSTACGGAADCDDGNPCTADVCIDGLCINTAVDGCCVSNADCVTDDPCEAGFCTDTNVCEYATDPTCGCQDDIDCDDAEFCTIDICNPVSNQCEYLPNPAPGCGDECVNAEDCDDGIECTEDSCFLGNCIYPPSPDCECLVDADCDDGQTCTGDACNNGECINTELFPGACDFCEPSDQCEDGNPCTINELCAGICLVTGQVNCDDGDPCTVDQCSSMTGECVSAPAVCDDGDPCTDDGCLPGLGCFAAPNDACECDSDPDCVDDDVCTANFCQDNQCVSLDIPGCIPPCGSDAECNDDDVCTADFCQNGTCANLEIPGCNGQCTSGAQCDDGDPCTADTCSADGVCENTPIDGCCADTVDCDDSNDCTLDLCIPGLGCLNNPSPGLPGCCATVADCEDGDACTEHTCNDSQCVTTPVPNCCETAADCPNDQPCTDVACTEGTCNYSPTPGCCAADADCDDGIACTTDSCDVATGQCAFQFGPGCCANDTDCDDGQPCTADVCGEGNQCTSAPVPDCCIANVECEDGDLCTFNQCIDNQCAAPVEIPGCCEDTVLGSEDFDSGELPGWDFELDGEANWQIGNGQSLSEPAALWFGNPATGNFNETNGQAPSGTATTPPFSIPDGEFAKVSFAIWVDTEQPTAFDQVELRVLTEAGQEVTVWDKSVLGALQTWQPNQVNLSAFAGQTIRLRWFFDAIDSIGNDGQGVFVDNLIIETQCEPLEICVFDGECDDGQACTNDVCQGGVCVNTDIPDCCETNAECDDNYVCTTDICNNGTCEYDVEPGCCQFDGECDDGNVCTADLCIANQCASQPDTTADGCCVTAADCDDGDACTDEICVDSTCEYSASAAPGCCTEGSILNATFDDATTQGFSFINDATDAKWSVQTKRFFSAPFSLYFGIPGEWTYVTEPASTGVAISPEVEVPLTADTVTLQFRVWVDILAQGFASDIFNVRVLTGSTLQTVWTFSDNPQLSQWITINVDLSEFKGQTIRLYWNFQSQESAFGAGGEGVYVDSVNVLATCSE